MFWSLTPRQVDDHFLAARRRHRLERNTIMETFYYASTEPHRSKPFGLKRLLIPLDDPEPKQPQSIDDMVAIARQWSAAVNRKR